MASGNAGNFQSIPVLAPEQVPIPATRGSVNLYMNTEDNLNIWTVDAFKVHRPVGSNAGIRSFERAVTPLEFSTLLNNPITVVPAPTDGTAIEIISGNFSGINLSGFANTTSIALKSLSSSQTQASTTSINWGLTGSRWIPLLIGAAPGAPTIRYIVNDPIVFVGVTNNPGVFGTPSGTIKIRGLYRFINP